MSGKVQSVDNYKKMGLQQLATWLEPSVIKKIKTLAFVQEKTIREVITERFQDVQVETNNNRVTVHFSKALEVKGKE